MVRTTFRGLRAMAAYTRPAPIVCAPADKASKTRLDRLPQVRPAQTKMAATNFRPAVVSAFTMPLTPLHLRSRDMPNPPLRSIPTGLCILLLLTAGCLVTHDSHTSTTGPSVPETTFAQIQPGQTTAGWVQ